MKTSKRIIWSEAKTFCFEVLKTNLKYVFLSSNTPYALCCQSKHFCSFHKVTLVRRRKPDKSQLIKSFQPFTDFPFASLECYFQFHLKQTIVINTLFALKQTHPVKVNPSDNNLQSTLKAYIVHIIFNDIAQFQHPETRTESSKCVWKKWKKSLKEIQSEEILRVVSWGFFIVIKYCIKCDNALLSHLTRPRFTFWQKLSHKAFFARSVVNCDSK